MQTDDADFLTLKQRVFCNEYLLSGNACEAAIKAGYSRSTAVNGQLMQMPKIKLFLQRHARQAAERTSVGYDEVLRELKKIASVTMGDLFDADGKVKPLNEINPDAMAAVQSVRIGKDGEVHIRLYNKVAALDRLARYLHLFDTPAATAQPTYVYLRHENLTDDDTFDDERLKAEIAERKKMEERQRRQEERAAQQQALRLQLRDAKPKPVVIQQPDTANEPEAAKPATPTVLPDRSVAGVVFNDLPEINIEPVLRQMEPRPAVSPEELGRALDAELRKFGVRPFDYVELSNPEKRKLLNRCIGGRR